MQRQAVQRGKLGLVLLATALIATALLVIPRIAFSVTPTISVVGDPFLLGETIHIDAEVTIDSANESFNAPKLRIFGNGGSPGSEDFTIQLPVDQGFKDLSDQLPKDGGDTPRGTLTVTVTHVNVATSTPAGGYAYGYSPSGANAKIDYDIEWTPAFTQFPLPVAPADVQQPAFAFTVPGGAGGEEALSTTFAFDVPGVPGAPAGSPVLGLAYDNVNGQVLVLVDGTTQDILLELDASFGFLNDFTPLTLGGDPVTDAQDVAFIGNDFATDGDAWVLAATPSVTAVIFDPFASGTPATLTVPGFPGEFPGGLAGVNDIGFPGEVITSELQTNPVLGITIHRIDVNGDFESNSPFGIPAGATGGGFNDIAFDSNRFQIVGSFGNALATFDPFGPSIFGTKATTLTDIVGLAMETNGDTLYLADAPSGGITKIHTADLSGGAGGPKFPKAIASEGANGPHYLLLDQDPDQIMEVDADGVQQGTPFTVDGSLHLESLTFLNGFLYTVEGGNIPPRMLYKIDPATEAVAAGYPKPLPNFINDIGGLTTDGTDLIAVERFNDLLHIIDPASAAVLNSIPLFTANEFAFLPFGLEGIAYVTPGGGGDPFLLGVRFPLFFEIDPDDGEITQVFEVTSPPPFDMTGITQSGNLMLMADSGTQQVYSAGVPGAPPPETTTAGNYTARFSIREVGQVADTNADTALTLNKVAQVVVNVTTPSEGDAFTDTPTTVTGTVNDPTITEVTLGIQLPSTDLLGPADFEAGGEGFTNTGLWHRTDDFTDPPNPRAIDSLSLAYTQDADNGNPGVFDFNTGAPNAGIATSDPFVVGQNTQFCSAHWYDNEGGVDFDEMQVRLKTDSGSTVLYQIVSFTPPFGGGFPQSGTFFTEDFVPHDLVFIEPFRTNFGSGAPIFTNLCVDLDEFIGQTVQVEFSFSSGDDILNDGEGWFVDEVSVTGAGAASGLAPLPVVNFVFSGPFALTEGSNAITVTAVRNAYETQTATVTVNVFLDQSVPVITLDVLSAQTNNAILTITGSFVEATPKLLELRIGTKTFTLAKAADFDPEDPTFSKVVNLTEGANAIVARLTDKGGLVGTDSASVTLDTAAPVISVLGPIYPVGEVSARAGDPIVFQVNATDAASGVDSVVVLPGSEPLLPINDISEAVRDQWQVDATATHILPVVVPAGVQASSFTLNIRVTDKAGTFANGTVIGTITASLQAFNIYLMPGANLVSTPLIASDTAWAVLMNQKVPNINATFKSELLASGPDPSLTLDAGGDATLNNVVTKIDYYSSAGTDTPAFVEFSPSPAADDLTIIEVGKGYWIFTDPDAFKESAPLAAGLPQTPAPIKFTIFGTFLEPGTVPPIFSIATNWNLMGLHSENPRQVEDFLAGLTFPTRVWTSLLEFLNLIKFEFEPEEGEERVTIIQGAFNSLSATDTAEPGRAYWLFSNAEGNITP